MIPEVLPPLTHVDPMLWRRLAPRIHEAATEQAVKILEGHWATLEEGKAAVAYLRALRWVLDEAAEMQRTEE